MPNVDFTQTLTRLVAAKGSERERLPEDLMPVVYDELRGLARGYLRGERSDHTLQPTALVNEAYLRLVDQTRVDWRGRTHFFAIGARIMRRLLVDHARGRGRDKRGGQWQKMTLDHELEEKVRPLFQRDGLDREDLLALHDALEKLTALDARQARIVELRFFAGLNVAEVAEVLGVSKRTVEGDWMHAKAWLRRELGKKT